MREKEPCGKRTLKVLEPMEDQKTPETREERSKNKRVGNFYPRGNSRSPWIRRTVTQGMKDRTTRIGKSREINGRTID